MKGVIPGDKKNARLISGGILAILVSHILGGIAVVNQDYVIGIYALVAFVGGAAGVLVGVHNLLVLTFQYFREAHIKAVRDQLEHDAKTKRERRR